MRSFSCFLLLTIFSSCYNDKIDKLESEVIEIKQSLLSIDTYRVKRIMRCVN